MSKFREYSSVPNIQPTANESTTLLDLPQELLDMIYNHAISGLSTRFCMSSNTKLSNWTLEPYGLPNLAFVAKQIRKDVILLWLQRTRLVFGGNVVAILKQHRALKEFLDFNVGLQEGYASIRMLSYLDFANCYAPIDDLTSASHPHALVGCCSRIRSLILQVASPLYIESWKPEPVIRTKEQMAKKLNCDALFGMTSLRHLRICIQAQLYAFDGYCQDEVFKRLREFLEEGFAKRGGEMNLEIVYDGV